MSTSVVSPVLASSKVIAMVGPAFQTCNCPQICQGALQILNDILGANPDLERFLDDALQNIQVVVDPTAKGASFSAGRLTLPHLAQLPNEAHDKSTADLLADSLIFESCNASRAADFATYKTDYEANRDPVLYGKQFAAIEVGSMLTYIQFAVKTPRNLRTGNMERALIRVGQAQQAGSPLRTFLLNAPHKDGAAVGDILGLPTRSLYIYQAIEDANDIQIQTIFLQKMGKKLGVDYEMGQVMGTTRVRFKVALKGAAKHVWSLISTKWPLAVNKAKRPARLIEILEEVASDPESSALANVLTKAAFGFDATMESVARANA